MLIAAEDCMLAETSLYMITVVMTGRLGLT